MLHFYKIGHLVVASDQEAKTPLRWSLEDNSIVELTFEDTAHVQVVRDGDIFTPTL